jgi:hypothetical protein
MATWQNCHSQLSVRCTQTTYYIALSNTLDTIDCALEVALYSMQTDTWTLCFVFGEFLQPGDKKKGLVNPTNGFLRFKKTKSPYLDKKNLEVGQCVPVGHQN